MWSLAILVVPILQVFAPLNSLSSGEGLLLTSADRLGLSEPADSIILLTLVAAGGLTVLVGWHSHRQPRATLFLDSVPNRLARVLGLAALGLGLITVFFPLARGDQVNMRPVSVIPIGVLLVGMSLLSALKVVFKETVVAALLRIFGVVLVIFVTTKIFQTASSLYDPYHYRFVASELTSVASGNFPLGGYVSQYSNLVPYLVAPAVLVLPFDSLTSVVIVSFVLQLTTALLAAKMLLKVTERLEIRVLGLVLLATYMVQGRGYHQVFPLRLFLPMVAFATMLTIFQRSLDGRSSTVMYCSLGAWLPILILNNPDHGIPAVIALLVAFLDPKEFHISGARASIGAMTLGFTVSLGVVIGGIWLVSGVVQPMDAFVFPKTFGLTGFMREPIALFDPVMVLFPLGLIALFLGFWSLESSSEQTKRGPRFMLRLLGTFQILTLAYPLGRSFSSTIVVSLMPSLMLIIIISDYLLTVSKDNRLVNFAKVRTVGHWIAAFLGVASAFAAGRSLASVQAPVKDLSGPSAVEAYVTESKFVDIPLSIVESLSGQLLEWSPIVELDFRVESLLVTNDPSSVTLISDLAARQCDILAATTGRVIMMPDTANDLLNVATCRRLWGERGIENAADSALVVLGEAG